MNLSVNSLKRAFIPKGNAIIRRYNCAKNTAKLANSIGFASAAAGIATLISKEPEVSCGLATLALSNLAIANLFTKKAANLYYDAVKIINRSMKNI